LLKKKKTAASFLTFAKQSNRIHEAPKMIFSDQSSA